jgi:hypothetical protein
MQVGDESDVRCDRAAVQHDSLFGSRGRGADDQLRSAKIKMVESSCRISHEQRSTPEARIIIFRGYDEIRNAIITGRNSSARVQNELNSKN